MLISSAGQIRELSVSYRFNPHVGQLASYNLESGSWSDTGYLCKKRDIKSAFHHKNLRKGTVETVPPL